MNDRAAGRERLDELAVDLLTRPDVTFGRMFSSQGLAIRGKIFAFAANDGSLVVKLPEERIGELGLEFMTMHERQMREWARVPLSDATRRWRAIAEEALSYVDSITP
ncbi:MAG TPA: hypothetical protein VFG92_02880 [Agromyces sp.]|nr:hypothetical protein [Agromyces sp.]